MSLLDRLGVEASKLVPDPRRTLRQLAFPLVALRTLAKADADLAENAVANLLLLSPRDLVRAYDFSKHLTAQGRPIRGGQRRMLERGIRLYLTEREKRVAWWDRTVLQHRDSMKRLYRLAHQKPSFRAQAILFQKKYPIILKKIN